MSSPTHPLPVHQHPLWRWHAQEGIHRRGGISGLPGIRQREISGSYLESRANEVGATPERGNGIE